MPDRLPERRTADRRLRRVLLQVYVLYAIVIALFVFNVAKISDRQDKTDETARIARVAADRARESLAASERQRRQVDRLAVARRNQTCRFFESQYVRDLEQLRGTYRFLRAAPAAQLRDDPITAFIVANLAAQRVQVRARRPPTYCKGDVGLNDSQIPRFPPLPKQLRPLLVH